MVPIEGIRFLKGGIKGLLSKVPIGLVVPHRVRPLDF